MRSVDVKNPTALEMLQELLEGRPSRMVIVAGASITAIIDKLREEQHITLEMEKDVDIRN